MAYIAKKGANWHVVLDGRESERYDAVFAPVFSPDSKRFAYAVKKGGKQFVVVDGKNGPGYDGIAQKLNCPLFSPDSAHLAYVAVSDKKFLWSRTARRGRAMM